MLKIKLTYPFLSWPILQQTLRSEGRWGNCQFYVNENLTECDYWVIYCGLLRPETAICSKENTIFFAVETCTIHRYKPEFLSQFGTIITSQRELQHPHVIFTQVAFPWHVGRREKDNKNIGFTKDYGSLKAIKDFKKDRLISVISSNKDFTEGHRLRLEFIKRLKDYFGQDIDVFGRGIKDIEDKWDAISPYKYHIVIENNAAPDYWTEKLSDAYLGGSHPFYYGCTNLENYFSKDSFTCIDIRDIEKSIKIIESCIKKDIYEKSIDKIFQARDLILDKYNLFPFIVNLVNSLEKERSRRKEKITIFPEGNYANLLKRCLNKAKHMGKTLFKA